MKRSKRIERVSEVGAREEQQAGQLLAAARESASSKQQLLEQLQGYRREYRALFDEQCAVGMDPQRFNNFQRFFAQLDQAIREQEHALAAGEQQVEHHRAQWLEKRQNTEILSRLTDRLRLQEHRDEQKQEQKQADERNSRRPPRG
ncbi:MAG: flagellar export protein FliJ [Halieaceae bacterium]|nr:flagellar export protein FliJ [Halieaceae bacterium]